MSKSIFVIDTPTSCFDCYKLFNNFHHHGYHTEKMTCQITDRLVKSDERDYYCPLIDLPEGVNPETDEVNWEPENDKRRNY